jgi:hypothetical protein
MTEVSSTAALSRLFGASGAPGGVLVDLAPDGGVAEAIVSGLALERIAVRTAAETAGAPPGAHAEFVDGDPLAPGRASGAILEALRGRRAALVSIGDALNRAADLDRYLRELRRLCHALGDPPVLVVTPNVTHLDVAAKLLIGRWDVTASGTLAASHVRHFSDRSLRSTMSARGWEELGAADLTADRSDQHFPAGAAPLERSTPVGALLCGLRESASAGAHVDRFVRLYGARDHAAGDPAGDLAGDPAGDTPAHPEAEGDGGPPFLSVLLRTQGRRGATLQESLLCLAAQTCDDFEVLVLLHDAGADASEAVRALVSQFHGSFSGRVRSLEVSGGGRCRPLNEGARHARGRYIAMLDDDDLVLADWVETFRDAATRFPGHVVRSAVATQRIEARAGGWGGPDGYEVVDRPRLVFALDFDHVDHLLDNRTPNNGYAFPRSLVTDLGVEWDESLPVLEDWDHLLRCASICGVVGVPRITGLLRWWEEGQDSKSAHPPELWEATRRRVIEKHDAAPLLLDRGTFSTLRTRLIDGDVAAVHAFQLDQETRRLSAALDDAQRRIEADARALEAASRQVEEMRGSRSWRITAGLRSAARLARKAAELRR